MADKCPHCGSYNTYTTREKSTFNTVACFVADAAIGIAEKIFFPSMPHHRGFSDCEDNKYTTTIHCKNCGRTS